MTQGSKLLALSTLSVISLPHKNLSKIGATASATKGPLAGPSGSGLKGVLRPSADTQVSALATLPRPPLE